VLYICWLDGWWCASSLDDLLLAGINLADNIVIVNKESSNAGDEDTLSDCNTIVAVQSIFRFLYIDFAAQWKPRKQSSLIFVLSLPFSPSDLSSSSWLEGLLERCKLPQLGPGVDSRGRAGPPPRFWSVFNRNLYTKS